MPHTLANDPAAAISAIAQAAEPGLIAIRRDIHAHPELGFQEHRTAGVVAAELTRLGVPFTPGIGGTGVVGLIEGGRPGPVLAIRADMDALPIAEETGLPFASTNPGLMHACGHDIHTTTLLGVAGVLRELAPQLAGTVKLVFQPAEEGLGGMAAMIRDGLMAGPEIDMALGFHNQPDMPVGRFGYVRGSTLAASDRFDITLTGKSGHAAAPHTTIDPIMAGVALVAQMQTVVAREVPPLRPAVVTVGAFKGGTTHNIIAESCLIQGTVRTLDPETRDLAEAAIRRLCDGIATGMRVTCAVSYRRGTPPLRNDDRVLNPAIAAIAAQFGTVAEEGEPSMGGEDFALLAELVPSFQLRVGSGAPGREDRLHNARYQPDEACIGLGVQALARAAVELLA